MCPVEDEHIRFRLADLEVGKVLDGGKTIGNGHECRGDFFEEDVMNGIRRNDVNISNVVQIHFRRGEPL
ncbi:hypothetical protein ATCV1_z216R [Acanthocystis turfacea chlorella virus 1]|uniref:Uncharacterized protein z216R n=1 Tax=Chlorovirus heliozoae TaxID=322019 RepID=A7K8H6_9PHYC|nr:hypothetical protein ATCV1_z216R [Acanthocystis turfacea chlorella virus 1]ABT16350.1 hypothetical protein ATCV1_z216R [Acanthocystis turfacea chlorella virus 1]